MCQSAPTSHRNASELRFRRLTALSLVLLAGWALRPTPADACGCLSPPIPMPGEVDFAVNQQAEQILFEVEPGGHIVAHVLIRYAGDPEQFAWIVPVPSVPELDISYAQAFGLIDQETAPQIQDRVLNLCPQPLYTCNQHPLPFCGNAGTASAGTGSPSFDAAQSAGTGAASPGNAGTPPAVTVYAREQIGSYDTIVFGSGDAQAAVDWLQEEGFIVNDTMSPYMEPYVAEGMLFVAAKLVPGADADEIRPLRMRYEGDEPMIPLQLTAVATEPHLTVTAYIYGDTGYVPQDQTLLDIDELPDHALATIDGRNNYPMLLARLFDEEGGRAFMLEYSSAPPRFRSVSLDPSFFSGGDCCSAAEEGNDLCGITADSQCQCPLGQADATDCADLPDLVEGVRLVEDLAERYPRVTRITTRLSANEMTFDPMFEADPSLIEQAQRSLLAHEHRLDACEGDVIDRERYDDLELIKGCASVYCGRGRCVATDEGPGCVCDPGQVARSFTDLDGQPSITCVPEEAPVDLEAGGLEVPDICGTLALSGAASCVNLAGFAGMRCGAGSAAVLGESAPSCSTILADGDDSGARDYTAEYEGLRICAPRPPACDARYGWMTRSPGGQRDSVEECESSTPHESWFDIPEKPTCAPAPDGTPAPSASGSGGISGSSVTTAPRPRLMQRDTTEPRMELPENMKRKTSGDDGCSLAGPSARPSLLVLGGLALLGLALLRRRAS